MNKPNLIGLDFLVDFMNNNSKQEGEDNFFIERYTELPLSETSQRTRFNICLPGPCTTHSWICGEESSEQAIATAYIDQRRIKDKPEYRETMEIRFPRELNLKHGIIIPKSKIKITARENDEKELTIERIEHKRLFWPIWTRTQDIRLIIPTELFLVNRFREYSEA